MGMDSVYKLSVVLGLTDNMTGTEEVEVVSE